MKKRHKTDPLSDLTTAFIRILHIEAAKAVLVELAKAQRIKPVLLTVDEYAAKWSIGRSTVRKFIREGRLRCTRMGRAVRIASDARVAQKAPKGKRR